MKLSTSEQAEACLVYVCIHVCVYVCRWCARVFQWYDYLRLCLLWCARPLPVSRVVWSLYPSTCFACMCLHARYLHIHMRVFDACVCVHDMHMHAQIISWQAYRHTFFIVRKLLEDIHVISGPQVISHGWSKHVAGKFHKTAGLAHCTQHTHRMLTTT